MLVQDAEWAHEIRTEKRLLGALVGTLARRPQQNHFLSVPLLLSEEEAWQLRAQVAEKDAHRSSDSEPRPGKRDYYAQLFCLWWDAFAGKPRVAARDSDPTVNATITTITRDEALREFLETLPEDNACSNNQDGPVILQRMQSMLRAHWAQNTIHLPMPSASRYYRRQSVLAPPEQPKDALRQRIFSHLHGELLPGTDRVANVLGCGLKFGGDFCLYAGDPCRYHSLAIVHCVPWTAASPSTVPTMLDIISWGRLGNVTKKSTVIASHPQPEDAESEDTDCVYFSINWFPIGSSKRKP